MASPGARSRTSTSGRQARAALDERRAGRPRTAPAATRAGPPGRGSPSGSGSRAAAGGARRPARPARGPCARARSSGPSPRPAAARRPAGRRARPCPGTGRCRRGSRPVREPSMTQPMAGPSGPNGSRRPEWTASTTAKWTRSIESRSPGSTSSTGPSPALAASLPNPRGTMTRRLAGDLAQGRQVEVVVVAMADEHGVEVREQLRQHGPDLAADGADARRAGRGR